MRELIKFKQNGESVRYYDDLPPDLLSLDDEELMLLCGKEAMTTLSCFLRSLIVAEYKRCQIESQEQRTLRGFWYQRIKPVMSRTNRLDEGKTMPEKRLSDYMTELVRADKINYGSLNIVDESRKRRQTSFPDTLIDNQKVAIVLCIEKDTMFPAIDSIAEIYNCYAYSSGGQSALSAVEDLTNHFPNHDTVYVLTMSDYDPSGAIIATETVNQIAERSRKQVIHYSLGITPDMLTDEELRQNRYNPKSKDLEKWFAETGGINGEPYGLELDCLSFSQIREIYVDCIEQIITDEKNYHDELRDEAINSLIYWAVDEFAEKLRDAVSNNLDTEEMKQSLMCDSDLIAQEAKIGESSVNYRTAFGSQINAPRALIENYLEETFNLTEFFSE